MFQQARLLAIIALFGGVVAALPAIAQIIPDDDPPIPPDSLKTIPVPESPEMAQFVANPDAARRLGKALFWDMQVGSDGVTSCASCHFHAGADNRVKNQVSPGHDGMFSSALPNYTLGAEDFPLRKLQNPNDANSVVLRESDDRVGSQGAFANELIRIRQGVGTDLGATTNDSTFMVNSTRTRRVTARNSPTVINAVFNNRNFWDGRADSIFNGVNGMGAIDEQSAIFIDLGGQLVSEVTRITCASLASQAVGPGIDSGEMSHAGRTWPMIGRKMLNLRPLDRQLVHPQDSLLGPYSRASLSGSNVAGQRGLRVMYAEMIRAAFHPQYWSSAKIVSFDNEGVPTIMDAPPRALAANEFRQIEANFALFFGLALQMYQATLVADDSPFDRFMEGDESALTERQKLGFALFNNAGLCIQCHNGAALTSAALPDGEKMELMQALDGNLGFYDVGFYNIAVRPTQEDLGVGSVAKITNPITGEQYPLSLSRRGVLKATFKLPPGVDAYVDALPPGEGFPNADRVIVDGAFKTPGLRNVELTGPYMHNGGMSTLRQVMDFYSRGGDFRNQDRANVHPAMLVLNLTDEEKDALVDFLLSLTDERVRQEAAPFDRPQLFVPHGQKGDETAVQGTETVGRDGFQNNEQWFELPAVGASGRPGRGLPPLQPFLELDPFSP